MLIREDELFMISTEITGETEMIPVEAQDAYAIKEALERDDIEELLVNICEKNEAFMELVENESGKDNKYIDNLITKIISEKSSLIEPIVEYVAIKALSQAFLKHENETLTRSFSQEEKLAMDLETIFAPDEESSDAEKSGYTLKEAEESFETMHDINWEDTESPEGPTPIEWE